MILALCLILSQDLWERSRTIQEPAERGRAEMRLGPLIDRSGGRIDAAKIDFDCGLDNAFSCGKFDLKASFGSVLNKDVAGDLLGASLNRLRDQLAGSSMVLACQMSPTLCDAMKHFRVTANEVLSMQLADCRTVEQLAEGATKSLRARAVEQCLAEKQAAGLPLDEALAACRGTPELRGLTGRRSPEIDLVQEVEEAFSLRPEARTILDELLGSTKLSAGGVRGDVKLRAVDASYERSRAGYENRLLRALQTGATDGLAPRSLPPMDAADLNLLRAMDPAPRRNAIAAIAAAHARVDLAELVHEVESLLEAAGSMADDAALRDALSRQATRLHGEMRRLEETAEASSRALEARQAARAAAVTDRDDKVRRGTAALRRDIEERRRQAQSQPWGRYCVEPFCPPKEAR